MFSDAYNNLSGTIDALVYVVIYGWMGLSIWYGFKILNKWSNSRKTNIPTASKGIESVRKISNPSSLETLDLPYTSNGYLRAAGWYEDPLGTFHERYFAGARWTSRVKDASGVEMDETNLPHVPDVETAPQVSPAVPASQRNSQTMTSDLAVLADLFQRGLLSEDEFKSAKDKLLH